jgi:hypothetical protein
MPDKRDPRPPRRLRRDGDGSLYDLDELRAVALVELAEEVRGGRRFRAHHHDSDRDCTQQVLLEVVGAAAPMAAGPALGSVAWDRMADLPGALTLIAGALSTGTDTRGEENRAARQPSSRHRRTRHPQLDRGDPD